MILGISGYARTGKSTAAEILERDHGFVRLSFADPVRAIVYDSNPDVRRVVDSVGWEQGKVHDVVRRSLQDTGTAIRRHLGADVLVDEAFRWMEPDRNYCLADCRYTNEAQAILAAGGTVVRIDRPGVGPVNGHVSETALSTWNGWSAVIANSGTVDDLAVQVAALVG